MSWRPRENHRICSAHFIGSKKSDNAYSPSFAPTIFPCVRGKHPQEMAFSLERHNRFMKRRMIRMEGETALHSIEAENTGTPNNDDVVHEQNIDCQTTEPSQSKACQVDFAPQSKRFSQTMVSGRFVKNGVCEAETQTIIENGHHVTIPNRKTHASKGCGTPIKEYRSVQVGPNTPMNTRQCCEKSFLGMESVKNEQQLLELTGVTYSVFVVLLMKGLAEFSSNCKKEKANILLIFLMKLKTGLSYSALGALFDLNRHTVQRYFTNTLRHLAAVTREQIVWPSKRVVHLMMPECFKPDFANVRTILDCTEFPIEMPASTRSRVLCYSHYKKTFTAKLLIGCAPNGLITFKSPCAGGRKSDSQIVVDSGFLNLIEDGDTILADKGFPKIDVVALENGKSVTVLKPPVLANPEFTKKETEETYTIAKLRIHVERVIQRIKIFKILTKIPRHLFEDIDHIVHVCCVLVNLQPPIISDVAWIKMMKMKTQMLVTMVLILMLM